MTQNDLIRLLVDAYSSETEKVAMVHLFGIKYAKEIIENGSIKDLVERAGLPASYHVEIKKGMNLAKYVTLNNA